MLEKRNYWIVGIGTAAVSFLLLFIGVKMVLGNPVNTQNIVGFVIVSLLAGILASSMIYLQMKKLLISFMIGLVIGFFEMYRAFINGMAGWGDLIGIMSLFTWATIGLGVGIVIQLGFYLYKRFKR